MSMINFGHSTVIHWLTHRSEVAPTHFRVDHELASTVFKPRAPRNGMKQRIWQIVEEDKAYTLIVRNSNRGGWRASMDTMFV